MDGPFPSLYPWDESAGLVSLTSAKYTPLAKVKTWTEAQHILDETHEKYFVNICHKMIDSMAHFWPDVRSRYKLVDFKIGIRAMPRSGADARLVDVVQIGERLLRVRAGKIDAVLHAEKIVCEKVGA
jgi:hypothetical protein